jgi:hypothetical protein
MVRAEEHPRSALLSSPTPERPDSFPTVPRRIAARPPDCVADETQFGRPVRDRVEPQSAEVPSCVMSEPACQDGIVLDARCEAG